MSFPLYDVLKPFAKKVDLTDDEKKALTDSITCLNSIGQQTVYAIIKYYSHLNHNDNVYGGKQLSNGIKFDLECFPCDLKHMLKQFVKIHSENEENDEKTVESRQEVVPFIIKDGDDELRPPPITVNAQTTGPSLKKAKYTAPVEESVIVLED